MIDTEGKLNTVWIVDCDVRTPDALSILIFVGIAPPRLLGAKEWKADLPIGTQEMAPLRQ